MWRSIAAKSRVVARNFGATKNPNNINKVYPSQSHISIRVSSQSSENLRFLSYFSSNPNENDHSPPTNDDSSIISGEHNDTQFEGLSEQIPLPFSENGDARMDTCASGDVSVDSLAGENVESKTYEIDVEKVENVLHLLQSSDDGSIESTLDTFSLDLHEEFVVKVLETPHVLGENLIRFFKWAMKKQDLSVTTRVIDVLVSSICSSDLRRKNAYALWDLVREIGEKNEGLVSVGSLNQLIALLSKLGKGKAALEVFDKSKDFGCVPDSETYYYTIEALCRRSFYDWAWIVCEKMLDQGPLPDSEKIGKIICWFCKGSKAKDAHTVYLLAKEKSKCPPKPALYFLIGSLCRDDGTVNLALEMLNDFEGEARKYAIKPFSSVIRGLCRIKDLDGAKQLLSKMIVEGPPPGNAVFNTVISGYCKGGNVGLYSVEELLGMILGFAGDLAEFHSKVVVKDAVVGVPAYFGQAERRGLVQAAQLAGINVLALINEHSGAALQYGIDKDFSNGSRYVVFYDMGASSTYAALVYFSAYNAKEFGKTVSVNQFQVKDVRWDPELGGQTMESRLVEYFADEFNKQVGNGVDVRKFPKAMAKLKKQVKRTKEILSANTVAPISVESLYDDRDFRSTITREKFEELCADLWDRSLVPLKEVLKHSGLDLDELYAVELIGGATRVPKLQAKLQEFLGKNELDKHLDADEAVVLGSSLHAANLSDGIKLNRKLGMVDGSSYGLVVELDGPDLLKDESTRQLLVPRMRKLPSKMFRSIIHTKDFEVSLSYEPDLLPPGVTSPVFAQYSVSGLADASEKYSSRNLSSPIKANLHFSLSRSGILSLDRADAVIEISEWVEVPKKNLTVENTTTTSPNITLETDTKNTTEESDEKLNSDGVTDNTSINVTEEPSTTEPITEKKLKRRTFRVPLKIVEKTVGPGMPLSEEYLAQAKRKLEELNEKDAERRRTAELKNTLEGYIYSTKEKLETTEEFEKISTDDERKSFIEKLDEVQEWLYTDGEDATAKEFQERLDSLKAFGDPIFFRYKELSARPTAIELARKYIGELQQIVQGWETKKPWLPKDRVDEVVSDADKLKSWLDEKEAEQKKASGFSTPVLTSEEIYSKVLNLQDKVASVNRIPKPKPKVEKPKKNKTETSGDNTNSADSTSGETPEKEKQTTDSDGSAEEKINPEGSADEKANPEPEVHDEL